MKILFTKFDRVAIPPLVGSSMYRIEASLHDETIDLGIREIALQPRELNGTTRMVAYDKETDTLFIKED